MKRKGQSGFTLVELLIVVAILAVLAAVVIPNVLGLMGRGASQAFETDEEVIQLATSTFYSDRHGGWVPNSGSLDSAVVKDAIIANPEAVIWGCNSTSFEANLKSTGHYYPTALARVAFHELHLSEFEDEFNAGSFRLLDGSDLYVATDGPGNNLISAHAIWMGLLVNGAGTCPVEGTTNRALAAPPEDDVALYLQEIPESSMHGETAGDLNDMFNGALDGGGYCWVVGKNGTVYGAYKGSDGKWYAGYSGGYP